MPTAERFGSPHPSPPRSIHACSQWGEVDSPKSPSGFAAEGCSDGGEETLGLWSSPKQSEPTSNGSPGESVLRMINSKVLRGCPKQFLELRWESSRHRF